MSVNTMTFEQSAAFLTALYREATGQQPTIQVEDTGSFTSVATTLLQQGYDPIIAALTQVIDRTIFSIREYTGEFGSISVDNIKWGSITRKINFIDTPLDNADQRLSLVDGQSIDQWKVKKPQVLQTNFYGNTVYQDSITIFRDQLDSAFSGPEEFGRFISGVLSNINDKLEQVRESEARGIVANFIGGKYAGDSTNCINVLQLYYDETGTELTPATMFNVDNYVTFTRWLAGYMETLFNKMGSRSLKYHMNVNDKPVMRHTKPAFMKKLISDKVANYIRTTVASGLYNPDRLDGILDNSEDITFWQNINDPYTIKVTPTYMTASGALATAQNAVTVPNIIGVFFDVEALGETRRSTWTASSPFNAAGGYYNIYWHFTQSTWNDFTENGVILYADTVVTEGTTEVTPETKKATAKEK